MFALLIGKGFKKHLDEADWAAYKDTYAGADIAENWRAFFNTLDFFRRLAGELGEKLGYSYQEEVDRGVTAYCRSIKERKKGG